MVCDHAANAIPGAYNNLGVEAGTLQEHVAWDIGARNVMSLLSERFVCTAIESHYSRLLVDLNRFPDHPTWIPATSDGVVIPGNQNLKMGRVPIPFLQQNFLSLLRFFGSYSLVDFLK